MIDTPHGEIDARCEKQLHAVEKALHKELQYALAKG